MNKKWIIAVVVITAIGAGIFYILTTGNIGAKYNTAEVKMGEVEKAVEETGRISSKAIRRYYGMGAMRVEEMTLALGDSVKKGQLLIRYEDNLDLEIQKVEKQIESLKAAYGEVLSGTDQAGISNAKIEISRIESNLALAEKTKADTEVLFSSGAVSKSELDQAIHNIEELQSSLAKAQNTYNQLAKGVSANTRKRYEAEIAAMRLTLDIYKKNKENAVIYADADGIVTELNTFQGDMPAPGSMILEIQDPSEKVLLVDFMVAEAQQIRPDMAAEIKDQNLGISMAQLMVARLYPKAFITLSELGVEENRQTVEISLPEAGKELPYGLELKTRVIIDPSRSVLMIPTGAVYQKNSISYVKVLEGKKPVERSIITGAEVNNEIEVKEGLMEGELVILNYQED